MFNRADALVALSESILQAPNLLRAPTSPRYEVIVHVDLDALQGNEKGVATFEDGWAVPLAMAQRLSCDAPLVQATVNGEGKLLDIGRRTRSIPPAIRRALRIRDRGCRFPGCTHSAFVDGHHIKHWAHGGATKLDNLVLLCPHHHRLVHDEGFGLRMEDGKPIFISPNGREIADVPEQLDFPQPWQMDQFPSFLSWLNDLDPDLQIETPGPVDGGKWDLDLAVGILCERYSGPIPEQPH